MKKPNMFRVLVTTVSMAAFALAPWPAYGQQTPVQAPPNGALATPPLGEHLKVQDGLIFAKYPGPKKGWFGCGPATMGNAVKALRDIYPDATFAIDPRVAEVPVTDLIVRADDPMTDLEALRTSCGGRFSIVHEPSVGSPVAEQNPLYSIVYNNSTEMNPSAGADRRIECFNLTPYLQPQKALDNKDEANTNKLQGGGIAAFGGAAATHTGQAIVRLQEIIQRSIHEIDPSISQPDFQFYADAQILIVIGPERAIEVAAKVIHALPGQPALMGNNPEGANLSDYEKDYERFLRNYQDYQRDIKQMDAYRAARKAAYAAPKPTPAPVPEGIPANKP